MRHPVAEYREQIHRGFSLPRSLPPMILMLAVLGVLIHNAGNPNNWRFFASGDAAPGPAPAGAAAKTPAEAPPEKSSQPAGLDKLGIGDATDEDFEEQQFMQEARQLIRDGSGHNAEDEMPAYLHVVSWVKSQSVEQLQQRAVKDALYDQFMSNPKGMRFKIAEFPMEARRVTACPPVKGLEGVDLTDVWGFTSDSGSLLYNVIVVDLPKGMPKGVDVQENVKFVGYFFKLQGYLPGDATTDQAAQGKKGKGGKASWMKAPMFIGRLIWEPSPFQQRESIPGWIWLALTGGVIVVVAGFVALAAILPRRRPLIRPLAAPPKGDDPEAVSVDEWLDQAQGGAVGLGNNFAGNCESNNGRADHRPEGPGNGKAPRFPGDFDTIGR
jgi:hypothetical protein